MGDPSPVQGSIELTLLLTELATRFDTLRPFYIHEAAGTAGYQAARTKCPGPGCWMILGL
jgi:hypothetical protein